MCTPFDSACACADHLAGAPYFSKSIKQGLVDVDILQLEVNYSKNGLKCTLKFEVEEHGGGHCSFGPSHRVGGLGRSFMW